MIRLASEARITSSCLMRSSWCHCVCPPAQDMTSGVNSFYQQGGGSVETSGVILEPSIAMIGSTGGSVNLTGVSTNVMWKKVGSLVTVQGRLKWTTIVPLTGDVTVTGALPFVTDASSTHAQQIAANAHSGIDLTTANVISMAVQPGVTTVEFFVSNISTGSGVTVLQGAAILANGQCFFSGTYFV